MERIANHAGKPCRQHKLPIEGICRSPWCDHYTEVCAECLPHHKHHIDCYLTWPQAILKATQIGETVLKGLHATRARKQQIEISINNNTVLQLITKKLQEIQDLIQKKIKAFQNNIKNIYTEHVKQKMQQLDQVIQKSQASLQRQLRKLNQKNTQNLSIFFKRDFTHELKYYDSYFDQIFIKKIRHFKTALQNDRIFSLIVNFQQKLQKIFAFTNQKHQIDTKKYHIFMNQKNQCVWYSLSKDRQSIQKKTIGQMQQIASKVRGGSDQRYEWVGVPHSVYYAPSNCYYIVGEGDKQSRVILKYEWTKNANDGLYVIKPMQTQRKHFGICQLNNQIYIVGGQNQRQGCLSRCQKFVPLYSNQVYIIHSLNSRSSRHSLTTYKDKYVLKFGGVKRLLPNEKSIQQNAAHPQIYSIQTEQWSMIPLKQGLSFYLNPSLFPSQIRGFILIMGGDYTGKQLNSNRSLYCFYLQENVGEIQQVKLTLHKTNIKYDEKIYNSTIALQEEDHVCVFMKSWVGKKQISLDRFKIQF